MTKKSDQPINIDPDDMGDDNDTLEEIEDLIDVVESDESPTGIEQVLADIYPPELNNAVDPDNDDLMTLAVKQSQLVQAMERMLVNHGDVIRTIRTHTPESFEECAELVLMHTAITDLLNQLVSEVCLVKTARSVKGGDKY